MVSCQHSRFQAVTSEEFPHSRFRVILSVHNICFWSFLRTLLTANMNKRRMLCASQSDGMVRALIIHRQKRYIQVVLGTTRRIDCEACRLSASLCCKGFQGFRNVSHLGACVVHNRLDRASRNIGHHHPQVLPLQQKEQCLSWTANRA